MIITGKATLKVARKVVAARGRKYLAVSYWGKGVCSELKLRGHDVRVVLDISSGSTHPEELQKLVATLGRDRVRIHADLHSKIYASASHALLGSANATGPGLLETRPSRVEASVELLGEHATDAYEFAKAEFERAEPYVDSHLEECRRNYKPPSGSGARQMKPVNIAKALRDCPASLREIPAILATVQAPKVEVDEGYQRLQKVDADASSKLDHKVHGYVGGSMPAELKQRGCFILYSSEKGALEIAYAIPLYDFEDCYFSIMKSWKDLNELSHNSVGWIALKAKGMLSPDEQTALREAMLDLESEEHETVTLGKVSDRFTSLMAG